MKKGMKALLDSINHWKENVETALDFKKYYRGGEECALCKYNQEQCPHCILYAYGFRCVIQTNNPWYNTWTMALEPTWNMLEVLMYIYLSEGGDPKQI
jgi:hypothetical protein